ncbi:MAG: hypothetical protein RMK29_13400 [Myxococcales bacterium]|nr:hypothetical protein [Myxococcota bacterium]MDW8282703.1 hypothetical protein [Myxococcales bacterium]
MKELDTDPTQFINQRVTLVGTARDAASGAVVLLSDGTPVYIRGLDYWDRGWNWKRIRASGVLREAKLAPDPEVNQQGEVSHGMYGDALVLEGATWEEAT